MSVFYYKGRKFINGYACNDAGKPITMNNGYSSEDEKYAKLAYEQAVAEKHGKKTLTENDEKKFDVFEQLQLFDASEYENPPKPFNRDLDF